MNEAKLRQLIQSEIQKSNSSSRYQLTPVQTHTHDGVNSPVVYQPTLVYAGNVQSDGTPSTPFPSGWSVNHGVYNLNFTGSLSIGATSGTLAYAWPDPDITSPITVEVTFSNGDVRTVAPTYGSTSFTWSGGLSSGATSAISTVATGLYLIKHNLNSTYYTATANPVTFNSFPGVALEINPDILNVEIFDTALQTVLDSAFSFILVIVNNRTTNIPTYVSS